MISLFSLVKYDGVKDIFKYLNPNVKMISRNIIVLDVLKVYLNEKESLKDELAKILGKVCFTLDLWTSWTQEGYIWLTTYYICHNPNSEYMTSACSMRDISHDHVSLIQASS